MTRLTRRVRVCVLDQKTELAREIVNLLEAFVHTGETDRGHIVEPSQSLQHGKADLLSLHLGPKRPSGLLHGRGQSLELLWLNWTVLTCSAGTGNHLAPVERLAMTGAFDDPQHCLAHPLDSREPPPARDAFTAAADSLTKFHLARVHDPIFGRPTPRAAHELTVAPIGYQRARPFSPFSAAGIGAGAAPRAQNPLGCRKLVA